MGSPLLMPNTPPWRRVHGDRRLRRVAVQVPTDVPATAAVFLVLRRLRWPLVTVIAVFAISVAGFVMIPGMDDKGNVYRMTPFDAFYAMTYTAATIGYGETPYAWTIPQRMWMTVCIFASVFAWAHALGQMFSLMQESGFRKALAIQRFRRKVLAMREPFVIIAGFGQAGRTLAVALDHVGHRLVVVDPDPDRIDVLTSDQLEADAPALAEDPRNPGILGLAGLGHPMCEGLLVMTDSDESNLASVMAAHLLRPDLKVITRCSERENVARLNDFAPHAVINPYDRYGQYLVLAMRRPVTYQLATWLLSEPGDPLPPLHDELSSGAWMVAADGRFGDEVTQDLMAAGLEVVRVDPSLDRPELGDVVGFVAGAESDTTNLSLAAHARLQNPNVYLSVRQKSITTTSLLEAFAPDQVFIATDLVAFEALARVESPLFWGFIEHVQRQSDEWSTRVRDELVERVGERSPVPIKLTINRHEAPAVQRWLAKGGEITLGQLLADHDDREQQVAVYASALVRDGVTSYAPKPSTKLQTGDQIGLLVRTRGRNLLWHNLFSDAAIEYLATGADLPTTWLFRRLKGIK